MVKLTMCVLTDVFIVQAEHGGGYDASLGVFA